MMFKKPCRDCGEMYTPKGKYQKYCEGCQERRRFGSWVNYKKKTLVSLFFMFFLMVFVVGEEVNSLGVFNQGSEVLIKQVCSSCTYVNITVSYPNSTVAVNNDAMTSIGGGTWTYTFTDTYEFGRYDITGEGDIEGTPTGFSVLWFEIKNTNLTFMIILLSLATLFFISSLFVNEEFFVYISGVLFLIAGIYTMINGIDFVNDWYSRSIAYVEIGLGLLFTVGAYIYNGYSKNYGEEEE